MSGVTRDRHYKSDWNGKEFSYRHRRVYAGSDDVFEEEIRKQVQLAIDEADMIVFVDVEDGITPMDEEVANLLRQVNKPPVYGCKQGLIMRCGLEMQLNFII